MPKKKLTVILEEIYRKKATVINHLIPRSIWWKALYQLEINLNSRAAPYFPTPAAPDSTWYAPLNFCWTHPTIPPGRKRKHGEICPKCNLVLADFRFYLRISWSPKNTCLVSFIASFIASFFRLASARSVALSCLETESTDTVNEIGKYWPDKAIAQNEMVMTAHTNGSTATIASISMTNLLMEETGGWNIR